MTATPPRADLRTLAFEAIWNDGMGPVMSPEDLADAVLAAVLPEHQRMVRRETLQTLLDRSDSFSLTMDGQTAAQWLPRLIGDDDKAAEVLGRLAAAAPPAGLSAPVPAENAPAVPEEADGQRATEGDALTYAEMEAERGRLAGELHEAQTELALVKSRPLFSTRKVMQTLLGALGDPVDEQELTLRIDDGLRLGDVAQRVIAALALTAAERDVVEAAKAWRAARPGPWVSGTDVEFHLFAAVDALPDVEPHQHECACNRNWGGPCGPCVCEEPPRQGVWRLTCGAGNILPNQTYATKGVAEDVMRLHDGACPGTHGVEFVPYAGTDQTEDEKPWPGLPTPGLHLVTVEDMNTCVRCGKFTGRADCPGDTAPEGADERNGHG